MIYLRRLLLTSLVTFTLGLLVVPSFSYADPQKEVRIGAVLPLTGDAASIGEAVRNGMLLAAKKLPPEVRSRIRIIFEDDSMDPMRSIAAFNKLLATDKIHILVNATSGTGNALAPLAEQKKIPFIAIASDYQVVKDRKWVVTLWVTPEEEARVAVAEAKRRGYKKIAQIASMQDGMLATKQAFEEQNQGLFQVVLSEEYSPEIKDFRSLISKLRTYEDLDALALYLMPGHLGIFAKQARQQGIKAPFFGIEGFEDRNEVRTSDGALIGQWYVNADEPGQNFLEEYWKAYPAGATWGAANGHDIVLLLGEAIKTGSEPAKINRFLHSVKDFSGALGTYSSTSDNRFTLPATVKIVTKDGFKKLQTQR